MLSSSKDFPCQETTSFLPPHQKGRRAVSVFSSTFSITRKKFLPEGCQRNKKENKVWTGLASQRLTPGSAHLLCCVSYRPSKMVPNSPTFPPSRQSPWICPAVTLSGEYNKSKTQLHRMEVLGLGRPRAPGMAAGGEGGWGAGLGCCSDFAPQGQGSHVALGKDAEEGPIPGCLQTHLSQRH